MRIASNSSRIAFDLLNNKTVMVEQFSQKPLKIVNPQSNRQACLCMLTSYGGGFVQGDKVALDVHCRSHTSSVISSQANTRVYESNGALCTQEINVRLETGAFHVFFNDPLVMHRDGVFHQKSSFYLQKDSVLLYFDWFTAGRTAYGEVFDFEEYDAVTKMYVEQKCELWDAFTITPKNSDVQSPGAFDKATSFVNVYLIGDKNLEKVKLLEEVLHSTESNYEGTFKNVARINENSLVSRYADHDLVRLKKAVNTITRQLEDKSLLHFDPLIRKY